MNFGFLIEELLLEMSPMEVYKKYYSNINFDLFKRIVSNDPKSKFNDGQIVYLGKYSKFLVSLYLGGNTKWEDFIKAKEYLGYVYKHQIPLDTNKVKTLSELFNLVKKYIAKGSSDIDGVLQSLSSDEYKFLMNSKHWLIYQPLTEKAACYLGVNSQWCTTWGPYSLEGAYKSRENYFNRYNGQGPIFIIINKNDEMLKYQFHFESEQYMDITDRKIDTGELLDREHEIRNFFFPSFLMEQHKKVVDAEMTRMDVLSTTTALQFIKKTLGVSDTNNQIINTIINLDSDALDELINDKNIGEILITKKDISFLLKKLSDGIESVEYTINDYENQKNNSSDTLREELSMDDYGYVHNETIVRWGERLEKIFEDYYRDNMYNIRNQLNMGIDYPMFKKTYFQNFILNEKMQEQYIRSYVSINDSIYISSCEKLIGEIKKYIHFINGSGKDVVTLSLVFFIKYILMNDIREINNINELIENYIDYYDVPSESEYIEYDPIDVQYKDMDSEVEDYFNEIINNPDYDNNCVQYREKFNHIYEFLFKNNPVYENEHVYVRIYSFDINCNNGMIEIEYKNKDNGKTYRGGVTVDNLPSYVTNYQLFENLITFKKNIS